MKGPDLDRERSEKKRTIEDFQKTYNENLPIGFPRATVEVLMEFKRVYTELFKDGNTWSLGQHRKKFMDWRPPTHRTYP